jgi:hypothetical protein
MEIQCPQCGSSHIQERNHAQKTLGSIGLIAGAGIGVRSVLLGSQLGMKLGMMAGPPGGVLGTFIGAIFGALISGNAGCKLGAEVGKEIDHRILNNLVCFDCDCTFCISESLSKAEVIALPYSAS